jgi:hypothetical protein
MTKVAGSGFGTISQWHGSADPDTDLPQNVMDPLSSNAVSRTDICIFWQSFKIHLFDAELEEGEIDLHQLRCQSEDKALSIIQ